MSGVAVGVGFILAAMILGITRNPTSINTIIRWPFIGSAPAEVSGSIGIIYPSMLSHSSIPVLILEFKYQSTS